MGKSKLLQGVVTLAGIVLYLLARKSKNKIRHTFLLILVCTMGVASFSCGNKSQKKVDLNKALDNAIETRKRGKRRYDVSGVPFL